MADNNTLKPYEVTNAYEKAEAHAFSFANSKDVQKRLLKAKENRLEDAGGRLSAAWIVFSVVGVVAAFGFGIFEAFIAHGAIAGLVDPMGRGIISPTILTIIGASFAIIGMMFGHGIFDSIDTDPIRGRKRFTKRFWICLVGSMLYVGSQFFFVKSAGAGLDSQNEGLAFMPYVVLGIALLELFVGAYILDKAFAYLLLFAINLFSACTAWKMNRKSKATNGKYREYLSRLEVYNNANSNDPIEREGNENIRLAIAYYTGASLDGGEDERDSDTRQTGSEPAATSEPEEPQTEPANGVAAQEEVESFVNDTIEDDLTA